MLPCAVQHGGSIRYSEVPIYLVTYVFNVLLNSDPFWYPELTFFLQKFPKCHTITWVNLARTGPASLPCWPSLQSYHVSCDGDGVCLGAERWPHPHPWLTLRLCSFIPVISLPSLVRLLLYPGLFLSLRFSIYFYCLLMYIRLDDDRHHNILFIYCSLHFYS